MLFLKKRNQKTKPRIITIQQLKREFTRKFTTKLQKLKSKNNMIALTPKNATRSFVKKEKLLKL